MSNKRRASIRRRRRQIQRNRRIALATILVLCSVFVFLSVGNISAKAHQESYKYYTDVKVTENDTLWSIAKKYRTKEYRTMNAYIKEVCKINGIGTEIYDGQILVIPYYSHELK